MRKGWPILLLFFTFCSLEKPKAPSWEMTVNLPAMNRTITAHDLIRDNHVIVADNNGLVGLHITGDIDTNFVDQRIKFPDLKREYEIRLENIHIEYFGIDQNSFDFSTLTNQATEKNGFSAVIEPFHFENIKGHKINGKDYEFLDIKQGTARVVLRNNLPVALSNFYFYLVDTITGDIKIQTPIFSKINTLEIDSLEFAVDNCFISSEDRWFINGQSDGSNGNSVFVNKNHTIEMYFNLSDFTIYEGRGDLPQLKINHKQIIESDSSLNVQDITVKEGDFYVEMSNSFPVDLSVDFTIPEIRHLSTGDPFSIKTTINADSRLREQVNLDKYKIYFQELGLGNQVINAQINAIILNNSDKVSLAKSDNVSYSINFQNVVLSYFKGQLDEYEIVLTPQQTLVDLPAYSDRFAGVNFDDAQLDVSITSSIDFPAVLKGTIGGKNRAGDSSFVTLSSNIQPGSHMHQVSTSLSSLSPENSNILQLVNLLPYQLNIIGELAVGDGIYSGEVYSTDYIFGQYFLHTPAVMAWEESHLQIETSEFRILPDGNHEETKNVLVIKAKDINRLKSLTLNAEIQNHLPVFALFQFKLANDTMQLAHSPVLLPPIAINSGITDLNGRVVKSRIENVNILLDENAVKIFQNFSNVAKSVFLGTEITILGTDGKRVKIYQDDYLKIDAFVELLMNVNKES